MLFEPYRLAQYSPHPQVIDILLTETYTDAQGLPFINIPGVFYPATGIRTQ